MSKPKIVIIGGGPAGEAAAKTAVSKGAEVTLIERDFLGGLCLNYGCIPSKTLLETVRKLHHLRTLTKSLLPSQGEGKDEGETAVPLTPTLRHPLHRTSQWGTTGVVPPTLIGRGGWQTLQKRKQEIVSGIRSNLQKHLQTLKVNVVSGQARFLSDHEISVSEKGADKSFSFDSAIIAGGTSAFFPPPLDQRRSDLLDSRSILALTEIPKSLLVAGGGAVGCEFACLFHELGTEVTIVEKTAGLLPGEDPNIISALRAAFESRGIRIFTDTTVTALEGGPRQWTATLGNGQTLSCEQTLVSIGRVPDTAGLGLDKAGVIGAPKGIAVNDRMQTNKPRIYAVGDITGTTRLAHAASAQGEVAATNACGGQAVYDGSLTPRCLYTWPEVASVGLWAYEAEAKQIPVKSQRSFFRGSATAMIEGETDGFFQVVSDKTSGKILGAQIIGPDATELIHIFSVALKAGMTTQDLRSVTFAHPSLAEGIKEALSR
jgi:dihydrolipoamide dehydrogenase